MIVYRLKDYASDWEHVAGATLGEQHIASLMREIDAGAYRDPVGKNILLSFDGILSGTSSYLKATALALYFKAGVEAAGSGATGEPENHFFPVIAGLNSELRDGIHEIFSARKLFCLEALELEDDNVLEANLWGRGDDHLLETLTAVEELEQATAGELREHVQSSISTTGWNNRLYDLYRLRLVQRWKKDRHWVYRPVAKCTNKAAVQLLV